MELFDAALRGRFGFEVKLSPAIFDV